MGDDFISDEGKFAKLCHAYNLCEIALSDLRLTNPMLAQSAAHMGVVTYYAAADIKRDQHLADALASGPGDDLVRSWEQEGRTAISWDDLGGVYERFNRLRNKTLAHADEGWLSKPPASADDRWVKDNYLTRQVRPPPGLERRMPTPDGGSPAVPAVDCGISEIGERDLWVLLGLIYFTADHYRQIAAAVRR